GPDQNRLLGELRADRARRVETRRSFRELELGLIWEDDLHRVLRIRIRRRRTAAENLSSPFDGSAQIRRSVEPVTLSQPFQRVFERLPVRHLRRHPPVAAEIPRNADVESLENALEWLRSEEHTS